MKTFFATVSRLMVLGLTMGLLSACLSSGEADSPDNGDGSDGGGNGGGSSNSAPTISGSPSSSTSAGQNYSFRPSASDPDGDTLTFSVSNLPSWASFDSSTGELSGTPGDGAVGTYANVSISVSDGSLSASLPAFDITVNQVSMGSATLTWTPPTQYTDGSSLNDLAGFKIYYGVTQGSYPNSVTVDNPGLTSYVVDNLAPNTYYFVSTAYNSAGVESSFSNVATKTVN